MSADDDLLHDEELPRERVWQLGATTSSDDALLAILLGAGTREMPVQGLARELIGQAGGFVALSRASPRELVQTLGVGMARATRIVAAFELGRRAVDREANREKMHSAADIFHLVRSRLAGLHQEVFLAIGLDCRNGILDVVEVARGSVSSVEVRPREVFRPLIRMAAAAGV